jgi:predicted transcriptional regulator
MKDNRLLVRVDAALKRRLEEAASETHKFRHAVRDRTMPSLHGSRFATLGQSIPIDAVRHATART